MNKNTLSVLLLLLVLLLSACGGAAAEAENEPVALASTPTTLRVTATMAPTFTPPLPTATLAPTFTPTLEPSETPEPSPTPEATETPEPTATPEASATAEATTTVEPTATLEPTPMPEIAAAPVQYYIDNLMHEYQRLNNCGPTSTAMALSYYGLPVTQYDIAPVTKGADTDKNVSPAELVGYIESQGLRARAFVNGDLETVQRLVANNIPVVLEQWLAREGDPLTGHYRTMRGYDQTAGVVIVNDSYTGPNVRYGEADFDLWWRAFNRLYIPVYRPEQEALVQSIIGEEWETTAMWQANLRHSEEEVATRGDVYDWFNLGTARLNLGDAAGAVAAFEEALAIGIPERLLWDQFAIFEAFNAAGQYERTLQLTQPYVGTLVEEIHFIRGEALEALGRPDEAIAEYRTSRSLNARYTAPQEALTRLGVSG